MLNYKRILVPYDGSEYAKRALDRAVSVARCCDGAKLFIATVSRPMPPMEKIAREKAYVFDTDKKEPEKKDPGQVILDDLKKTATWSSWATGAAALSRAFSWVPFPAIWQAT